MPTLDTDMRQRLLAVAGTVADTYLQVDITAQTLALVEQADIAKTYPVSTSKFGAGNQEGSFKTPLGIHRITEKIGAGKVRVPTATGPFSRPLRSRVRQRVRRTRCRTVAVVGRVAPRCADLRKSWQ